MAIIGDDDIILNGDLIVGSNIVNTPLTNALDAYGAGLSDTITTSNGADGYVAFFTTSNSLEGNQNLQFDVGTNKLSITNGSIKIGDDNFGLVPDGYLSGQPVIKYDINTYAEYDRTNKKFIWWIDGYQVGSLTKASQNKILTGTSNFYNISSAGTTAEITLGSYIIPANSLQNGSFIRYNFAIKCFVNSNLGNIIHATIKIKINNEVIALYGGPGNINIISTDTPIFVIGNGIISLNNNIFTSNSYSFMQSPPTVGGTIFNSNGAFLQDTFNYTIDNLIQMTIQWDSVDGNTTVQNFILEVSG